MKSSENNTDVISSDPNRIFIGKPTFQAHDLPQARTFELFRIFMVAQATFESCFVNHLTQKRRQLICLVPFKPPYVTCIARNTLYPIIYSLIPNLRQKIV